MDVDKHISNCYKTDSSLNLLIKQKTSITRNEQEQIFGHRPIATMRRKKKCNNKLHDAMAIADS